MLKKHHRLNSPPWGSCSLCEHRSTRLSTLKFQHKFGITTITTSLCSTKEIQIRETVFPIITIMYSLDGVDQRRRKTFLYESQVFDAILICCYNLLKQGIIFLGVIGPLRKFIKFCSIFLKIMTYQIKFLISKEEISTRSNMRFFQASNAFSVVRNNDYDSRMIFI